jgi:LPXTG-motif cell wall-anchored protein
MRRPVALLLAVLMLALPAVATAQNAGDEQYADPFGQTQEPKDSQGEQPPATQEPAPAEPAPAEPAPAAPAQEQPVATQDVAAPTLPHTGIRSYLLAGAGALLLAAGATLRRLVL